MKRILAFTTAALITNPVGATGVCFPQSTIASITPSNWIVEMPAPCEDFDGQSTYQYNPQNQCATGNEASNTNSTEMQSTNFVNIWRPRYMGGPWTAKPNPPPGAAVYVTAHPDWHVSGQVRCGVSYATYGRANAAWASAIAYNIGRGALMPNGTPFHNGYWDPVNYYDPMPSQQLVGMTAAQFAANATSLCNGYDPISGWAYALNVIVWPDVRLVDITIPKGGVRLDIENHDGDSVADTHTVLTWAVANVHQKLDPNKMPYNFKVNGYTNPFNGPMFYQNGLDPDSECQVMDKCNIFTVAGSGTASSQMLAELALVPHVSHDRLYWLIDMQETPQEIADARIIAIAQGLSGVSFLPNGVAPCSTQWNAVVSSALGLP